MKSSVLLYFCVFLLWGCSASLHKFPFDRGNAEQITPLHPGLQIQYFSVGCFYLEANGIAVLTDPFWSHLPFKQVAFGNLASDSTQIDPYLPSLERVKTVLVSHSHYDHMLDLPYISPKLPSETHILGSHTLKHMLATTDIKQEILLVNDHMATESEMGDWFYFADSSLRVMPIQSAHPPHLLGIHLYGKKCSEDFSHIPCKAKDFQEGVTVGWLIDFLAKEETQQTYRIYLETSSTGWPAGYFPKAILNAKEVDVALLPMDCAKIKAKNKRSIIDFLQPKEVIFCHWENFFRDKTKTPKEVIKVNLSKLRKKIPNTSERAYRFPAWSSVFHYD